MAPGRGAQRPGLQLPPGRADGAGTQAQRRSHGVRAAVRRCDHAGAWLYGAGHHPRRRRRQSGREGLAAAGAGLGAPRGRQVRGVAVPGQPGRPLPEEGRLRHRAAPCAGRVAADARAEEPGWRDGGAGQHRAGADRAARHRGRQAQPARVDRHRRAPRLDHRRIRLLCRDGAVPGAGRRRQGRHRGLAPAPRAGRADPGARPAAGHPGDPGAVRHRAPCARAGTAAARGRA